LDCVPILCMILHVSTHQHYRYHHPNFFIPQIVLGPKLGEGEFSNVFEVDSFKLHHDIAQFGVLSAEESKQRLYLKQQEKYGMTQQARYALKHIKERYHHENDPALYAQAAG
jgi:hypothetical protein